MERSENQSDVDIQEVYISTSSLLATISLINIRNCITCCSGTDSEVLNVIYIIQNYILYIISGYLI